MFATGDEVLGGDGEQARSMGSTRGKGREMGKEKSPRGTLYVLCYPVQASLTAPRA